MTRVISFRVTEVDWLGIERAAADNGDKPNDWCRTIALETIKMPVCLTRSQRILFNQMARVGWLVENGFQLLADDKLGSDDWKRYRAYAKANLAIITDRALEELSASGNCEGRTRDSAAPR